MCEILEPHVRVRQIDEIVGEAGFRLPPEIQDDFDERIQVRKPDERLPDRERKNVEESGQFPVLR